MNFYYSEEGKYCTHTVMEKKPFFNTGNSAHLGFYSGTLLTLIISYRWLFKNANEDDYSAVRNVSMYKNVFKNKNKKW